MKKLLLVCLALLCVGCAKVEGLDKYFVQNSAEKTAQNLSTLFNTGKPQQRLEKLKYSTVDAYGLDSNVTIYADDKGGFYQLMFTDYTWDKIASILEKLEYPKEAIDIFKSDVTRENTTSRNKYMYHVFNIYKGNAVMLTHIDKASETVPRYTVVMSNNPTRVEELKNIYDNK